MINSIDNQLWWTLAVFAAFLLDWAAVASDWKKIKPFAKVLAIVTVIIWTMAAAGWRFEVLLMMLLIAQSFGLDGDVFLLFADRYFLQGLAAFLMGHLLYISLLVIRISQLMPPEVGMIDHLRPYTFSLIIWMCILIVFYSVFNVLPKRKLVKPAMWYAIQIYGWVLSGFVALTLFTAMVFGQISNVIWFLPLGAFLFLISDSLLAYDRFIKPIWSGQLWVHITYHCAQFCLALGFVTFLSASAISI